MDFIQAREVLRKRFYFIKKTSGQNYYYDSETGDRNLTFTHLIPHHQEILKNMNGGEYVGINYVGKTADGFKEISGINFDPILLNPIYVAGADQKVVLHKGNRYPNSWHKPEIQPIEYQSIAKARAKEKGAGKFIEHLQRMLGDTTDDLDNEESKAGYLIRMLAYRYQHHNFRNKQKPHVAFYFYGKQGYGKGIFADTLQAVFGETAITKVPDEKSLTSMSSVDIFSRTWAIVDEVNIGKGSTNYNTIKTHTGTTQTSAARKGEHFRPWYIPAQLIMFSQKPPTFIETGDRRFFISKWDCTFKDETEKEIYFNEYTKWLQDEGGYEAIAGLLQATDASTISLAKHAMMTPEKRQVTTMVTDDAVTDIKLIVDEDPVLVCFTENDFCKVWAEHDINKNQISYKMQEAGLVETEKRKYDGKHRKFYLREGYELERRNGQKSQLICRADPSKSKFLDEDAGYLNSIGSHDWQAGEF